MSKEILKKLRKLAKAERNSPQVKELTEELSVLINQTSEHQDILFVLFELAKAETKSARAHYLATKLTLLIAGSTHRQIKQSFVDAIKSITQNNASVLRAVVSRKSTETFQDLTLNAEEDLDLTTAELDERIKQLDSLTVNVTNTHRIYSYYTALGMQDNLPPQNERILIDAIIFEANTRATSPSYTKIIEFTNENFELSNAISEICLLKTGSALGNDHLEKINFDAIKNVLAKKNSPKLELRKTASNYQFSTEFLTALSSDHMTNYPSKHSLDENFSIADASAISIDNKDDTEATYNESIGDIVRGNFAINGMLPDPSSEQLEIGINNVKQHLPRLFINAQGAHDEITYHAFLKEWTQDLHTCFGRLIQNCAMESNFNIVPGINDLIIEKGNIHIVNGEVVVDVVLSFSNIQLPSSDGKSTLLLNGEVKHQLKFNKEKKFELVSAEMPKELYDLCFPNGTSELGALADLIKASPPKNFLQRAFDWITNAIQEHPFIAGLIITTLLIGLTIGIVIGSMGIGGVAGLVTGGLMAAGASGPVMAFLTSASAVAAGIANTIAGAAVAATYYVFFAMGAGLAMLLPNKSEPKPAAVQTSPRLQTTAKLIKPGGLDVDLKGRNSLSHSSDSNSRSTSSIPKPATEEQSKTEKRDGRDLLVSSDDEGDDAKSTAESPRFPEKQKDDDLYARSESSESPTP